MNNINENIRKELLETQSYFGLIIAEDGYVQPMTAASDIPVLATEQSLLDEYVKDNTLGIALVKGELMTLFIKGIVNRNSQKIRLLTNSGSAEIDFSEYAENKDEAIRYLESILNIQ